MYTGFIIGIAAVFALVLFVLSIKLLARFGWILQWVRGTIGLAFLAFGVVVVVVAMDMLTYKEVIDDQAVATLTFSQVKEQEYSVEVSYVFQEKSDLYTVHGDQWQMDARIVRLRGFLTTLGAKPGFRLDRLSGRYYSLADERRKTRSVYKLDETNATIDFWSLLHSNGNKVPWIEAVYGSATYLPMADKAIFQVSLSDSGLTAKPINEPAENAVQDWK